MGDGITHYLRPEELRRLGRLALGSRYVVEGNLAGAHRSPQRGSSSEFADHRAYIAGDDPKRIDWRVLARTDRYFVRRFEDETNLRVYLIVDRSASMGYASRGRSKLDYASHLAAALGYVAVKGRDSVGLFLHADSMDARIEAGNTFLHLNNLLRRLQAARPGSTSRIAGVLHEVAESIRRRALVVILSDLFEDPAEINLALAHFRKYHHDVIVLHVLDPAEVDFPFTRGSEFEDMETGEKIAVDPRALAGSYRAALREFTDGLRAGCAELKIDYRLARTDADPERFVRGYLEERQRLSR